MAYSWLLPRCPGKNRHGQCEMPVYAGLKSPVHKPVRGHTRIRARHKRHRWCLALERAPAQAPTHARSKPTYRRPTRSAGVFGRRPPVLERDHDGACDVLRDADAGAGGEKGIYAGKIKSIIPPPLASHVRREAVKFIDEFRRTAAG